MLRELDRFSEYKMLFLAPIQLSMLLYDYGLKISFKNIMHRIILVI